MFLYAVFIHMHVFLWLPCGVIRNANSLCFHGNTYSPPSSSKIDTVTMHCGTFISDIGLLPKNCR